jgi:hypothetical protein
VLCKSSIILLKSSGSEEQLSERNFMVMKSIYVSREFNNTKEQNFKNSNDVAIALIAYQRHTKTACFLLCADDAIHPALYGNLRGLERD